MPEVWFVGIAQVAETPQFPQSMRPLAGWVRQFGWFWGNATEGWTVATLRAPLARVPAEPVDVHAVVGGRRVYLEPRQVTGRVTDVRGVTLDGRVPGASDIPLGSRIAGQQVLARDAVAGG